MSNDQSLKTVTKKCLILSQGPVLTPEHNKVEGGGLRCWGLAKGLLTNDPQLELTVAYHESYRQATFTDRFEGIDIATWNLESIPELIKGYDSILVSYCMGGLSVAVAQAIQPDQQLILDCYVPIYVEFSARDTEDIDREYYDFHNEVGLWDKVLKRGDLFLCANEAQRKYYRGVLSAIGRVNPATYGQDLLRVVPYGIYREKPVATTRPITKLMGKDSAKYKKLLWFGGIYPWFDLKNLVDAVAKVNDSQPAKLIIVGAKNPFNDHPDFTRKYDELMDYIESEPRLQSQVIVQDWVEFDKRADWYLDSDLVVVVNKEGEENELAWRTRLVDFLWADLPIITNGGDPLGEMLLANKAAEKFHGLSKDDVAADLLRVLKNDAGLSSLKKNLSELRKQFYWDTITQKLAQDIAEAVRARDLAAYGDQSIAQPTSRGGSKSKLSKGLGKARMIPAYARKYGMRNTYFTMRTTLLNQFRKVGLGQRDKPGVVMIAHQLDLSGAPYVFMDLAKAIKQADKAPIEFHSFNPSHKDNIVALNRIGIKPRLHLSKEVGVDFVPGDVVVLNTVAHTTPLKESIYRALESNTVRLLAWFVHEDEPELIFSQGETKRIKEFLKKDKLIMYIAADKALHNYQKYFENTKNIRKQPYKYVIPKKFQRVRSEQDFESLSFMINGSVADGRKGQLPIFYAFKAFLDKYHQANPKAYRDFELVYVGLGPDFLSRQMLRHAPGLFGKRFKHYGFVSHERSSELMMQSNITICYSLRECLPLFVFEGMATGHPILRNDSSGMEEQLINGKNGIYLDSNNFDQVVDAIESVLNLSRTSNKQLADMSKQSNRIALEQAKNSYEPMVKDILREF